MCLIYESTAPGGRVFGERPDLSPGIVAGTTKLALTVWENTTLTLEDVENADPDLATSARRLGYRSLWVAPIPALAPDEQPGALALWRPMLGVFNPKSRRVVEGPLQLGVRLAALVIGHHRTTSKLMAVARRDPLTGVANRRVFDEALDLARASGRPFGLIFADLDGFKLVNDAHGHAVGDRLLIEVGRRLDRAVRRSDRVVRLGGMSLRCTAPISTNRPCWTDSSIAFVARLPDRSRSMASPSRSV